MQLVITDLVDEVVVYDPFFLKLMVGYLLLQKVIGKLWGFLEYFFSGKSQLGSSIEIVYGRCRLDHLTTIARKFTILLLEMFKYT